MNSIIAKRNPDFSFLKNIPCGADMCSVLSQPQCDCFFWQVVLKKNLTSYFLLILKHLVLGKDVKSVTNEIE